MGTAGKVDWQAVRARYESWWQGEPSSGPLIQVTAPAGEVLPGDEPPISSDALYGWFTNPADVIPRLQREVARTYYGGDAFPVIFPFSTGLPAIEAAYLGCPYHIVGSTGWAEPLILDWEACPPLQPDPQNKWWQLTQALLEAGAASSQGRYCIGIPDLEGGGEIIAMLRGTQPLAYDLLDHPQAVKKALSEEINVWQYYYLACFEIIHRHTPNLLGIMPGYVDWLGIWSERPFATVENDFSTMISPAMFRDFFLPSLDQQIHFLDRSIFHLDGPEALPHLDTLLSLPRLDGIQWVLGPGDGLMTDWIPLLQKIQGTGKKVVAACQPAEVLRLLQELKPELLLLTTSCSSINQAEILLAEVASIGGSQTPAHSAGASANADHLPNGKVGRMNLLTDQSVDGLLNSPCPSIRYRLRRELVGQATDGEGMAALQAHILQDKVVQEVLSWQQPDGWLAWAFHGNKATEAGIRLLCEKGVEPHNPRLAAALAAVEKYPERRERGIGNVGVVLDEQGFGGTQMMSAVVLAYAGIEDRPFISEQIQVALEGFEAVLGINSLVDLVEDYRGELVFKPGRCWPSIYHLRLLAWTHRWRTAHNLTMLAQAVQRLAQLSPLPRIIVRSGSRVYVPGAFAMHDFNPEMAAMDAAQWMMWFHRMEMLARLGVIRAVPELRAQIQTLKAILATSRGWFTRDLAHGSFKNWGAYAGLMLEPDWKAAKHRSYDLTFRSLLIFHYTDNN